MVVARILKFVGFYFAVSILFTGLWLISLFPYHPKSIAGWIVFFLVSLPVTLAGEALGKPLWENSFAKRLDKKTAGKEVSWLRMSYIFIVMVLLLGLTIGAGWFFGLR